jgi:hypothetical protein
LQALRGYSVIRGGESGRWICELGREVNSRNVEGGVGTPLAPSGMWNPVGALCIAPRTGISLIMTFVRVA